MKIKVKTLKSIEHDIEVSNEDISIKELKDLIEEQRGFETESIKLLFNGLLLEDKKLLSDYKIKEDSVLIIMISKIKKKNEDNNIKEIKEDENKEVKVNIKKEVKDKQEVTKEQSDNVKRLVEMGFTEAESKDAIEKNNNDFKASIMYLAQNMEAEDFGDIEDEEQGEIYFKPEMLDNFNVSEPNAINNIVSVIKVLVSQDPTMLQDLIEEVGESNEQILKFIKENEVQFKELMAKPINNEDYKIFEKLMGDQNQEDHSGVIGVYADEVDELEGAESEAFPENIESFSEITKDFTEKDNESINNLVKLGFSKVDAIQAYIACDKNEEQAANLLFTY